MKPVQPKTIDKEKVMRDLVLAELKAGKLVIMISAMQRLYKVQNKINHIVFTNFSGGEISECDIYFSNEFYSFGSERSFTEAIKNGSFNKSQIKIPEIKTGLYDEVVRLLKKGKYVGGIYDIGCFNQGRRFKLENDMVKVLTPNGSQAGYYREYESSFDELYADLKYTDNEYEFWKWFTTQAA